MALGYKHKWKRTVLSWIRVYYLGYVMSASYK